jgi:hypothetical protein
MGGIESAIGKGADQLIVTWGPPGFFILLLLAVVVYLWFEVKNLNRQVNDEIKAGVAMAQEFRKAFEARTEVLRESRRDRGN